VDVSIIGLDRTPESYICMNTPLMYIYSKCSEYSIESLGAICMLYLYEYSINVYIYSKCSASTGCEKRVVQVNGKADQEWTVASLKPT